MDEPNPMLPITINNPFRSRNMRKRRKRSQQHNRIRLHNYLKQFICMLCTACAVGMKFNRFGAHCVRFISINRINKLIGNIIKTEWNWFSITNMVQLNRKLSLFDSISGHCCFFFNVSITNQFDCFASYVIIHIFHNWFQ